MAFLGKRIHFLQLGLDFESLLISVSPRSSASLRIKMFPRMPKFLPSGDWPTPQVLLLPLLLPEFLGYPNSQYLRTLDEIYSREHKSMIKLSRTIMKVVNYSYV